MIETMRTGSRLDGAGGSFALALAAFVALFPTLARSAQSGDGVELVRVALGGGVPHPTGFPLQAWIDRAVVLLPLVTPAFRLALLDLAAHAATVFVGAEILRRLGVGFTGRAAFAVGFAAFPPVWELAVVPEVFPIAHLLIAALLLQLVVVSRRTAAEVGVRDAVALGTLVGLAAAQHPITLEAAPIFLTTAYLVMRERRGRGTRLAAMAGPFLAIVLGMFASLPHLRSSSVWPDWGDLSGPRGVVEHALRTEYGSLSLSGDEAGRTISGIGTFGRDLVRYAALTVVFAAIGSAALARDRARRLVAIGLGGMLVAGLSVLLRARMPAELLAMGYLPKLDGPTVFALAVLAGIGVDAARRCAVRPPVRRLCDLTVAACAVGSLLNGWSAADASRDDTLDLVATGIGGELPRNAVYLAENDVESFLGAATPGGTRFPLVVGLLPQPWYVDTVAPRVEPRVKLSDRAQPTPGTIVGEALSEGLSVASTNEKILEVPGHHPTLEGLLYVEDGRNDPPLSTETVRAAVALCPVVDALPALPADGHVFSRHFFHRFSRAYEGAALYLESEGETAPAAAARDVEHALDRGDDRSAWIASCDRLTRETESVPHVQ